MEAVNTYNNIESSSLIRRVLTNFFNLNSTESSRIIFWKIFQCWTIKDCKVKAEISDEEVALFFDQLIDLVAAAYILHEANKAPKTEQEGNQHE